MASGSAGVFTSLVWLHQLLCDIIEEVPASICEGALQERQRDQPDVVVTEGLEGVCWLQPVIVTWYPKTRN